MDTFPIVGRVAEAAPIKHPLRAGGYQWQPEAGNTVVEVYSVSAATSAACSSFPNVRRTSAAIKQLEGR